MLYRLTYLRSFSVICYKLTFIQDQKLIVWACAIILPIFTSFKMTHTVDVLTQAYPPGSHKIHHGDIFKVRIDVVTKSSVLVISSQAFSTTLFSLYPLLLPPYMNIFWLLTANFSSSFEFNAHTLLLLFVLYHIPYSGYKARAYINSKAFFSCEQ